MTRIIEKIIEFIFKAFTTLLILLVPVNYLWNWLMPLIFNLPEISYVETIGLMLLSEILIKPISSK